jgi:hypothetical protein
MRSSHENIYRSLFPRYGSKVVAWAGRHASLIQQDERRPQGTEIEQVYSSQWRKLSDQVEPKSLSSEFRQEPCRYTIGGG